MKEKLKIYGKCTESMWTWLIPTFFECVLAVYSNISTMNKLKLLFFPQRKHCITWTVASSSFKRCANSSHKRASGYFVILNKNSNCCSWNVSNFVLALLKDWIWKVACNRQNEGRHNNSHRHNGKECKKRRKNAINSTVLQQIALALF